MSETGLSESSTPADGQPAEATDATTDAAGTARTSGDTGSASTTAADPDIGSRPERRPESTNPAAGSESSPQPGAGSSPEPGAGSSPQPGAGSSASPGSESSSEVASAAETAHRTEAGIGAKTDTGTEVGAGETGTEETGTATDTDTGAIAEGAQRRPWLLIALAVVAAVAVVLLLVTALLWPGYLVKPGSPNGTAAEATSALATKNASQLDAVTCRDRQGARLNPLPPQALALIQSVRASGPAVLELDTQARVPVDLTLSAQGQPQALPADIVLAVTDGHWCMTGITERQ